MREYGGSASSPTSVMRVLRRLLADGFGGNHTGRAGAQDDVVGHVSIHAPFGANLEEVTPSPR